MQNSLNLNKTQQSFYSINEQTKLDFSNYPVYETSSIKLKMPPISPQSLLKKLQSSKIKQSSYNLDEFRQKQAQQQDPLKESDQTKKQSTQLTKNQNILDDFKSIRYDESNIDQQLGEQEYQNQSQFAQSHQNQNQQKSVQISLIKSIHDKSQCFDVQMMQLTRQLQRIQDQNQIQFQQSKESHRFHQENIQINKKCQMLTQKVKKLKQDQLIMQKQMITFCQILKKTKMNNDMLQKELQYFSDKMKKQKQNNQDGGKIVQNKNKKYMPNSNCPQQFQFINQIGNKLNNLVNIQNIQNPSRSKLSESRQYDKKYRITPTKFNKSAQNLIYKKYSLMQKFQQQEQPKQHHWIELHRQQSNQYRIIASHHQHKVIVRLVQVQSQSLKNQQLKTIKKNYQYFIDLPAQSSDNQSKLNSLQKQIVIDMQKQSYQKKQFVKKVSLYIMITQQGQSYVDFVKYITLPNPINFYFEKRFNQVYRSSTQNRLNQKLNTLIKQMFLYRIQIKKQADLNTIQALRQLWWLNVDDSPAQQPKQNIKYFSIRGSHNLYYVGFKNITRKQKQKGEQNIQEEDDYGIVFTLGYSRNQQKLRQSNKENKQKKDQKRTQEQLNKRLVDTQIFSDIIQYLCFMTVL